MKGHYVVSGILAIVFAFWYICPSIFISFLTKCSIITSYQTETNLLYH